MEEQDLFDKFVHIKDSYEPDPDLANRVIERINQRESTVAFKQQPAPKWFWCALCFIFVVTLTVFLCVYLIRPITTRIIIYSAESIESEDINNLDSFISDNKLNFKYFKDEFANNSVAKIKDTGTYAYVRQLFNGIGENGFDYIEFKVVLLQYAEFEFYSSFNSLNKSISIENISVDYSIYDSLAGCNIFAKFGFEDKSYFLEISTSDSGTAVIEKYVNKLIK